jgi:hypothetical protein
MAIRAHHSCLNCHVRHGATVFPIYLITMKGRFRWSVASFDGYFGPTQKL